jgi:HSP20 family protein
MWSELENLQSEMNKLISSSKERRVESNYPPVNAWTNDEEINITAELPGVNPENIQISVQGNTLSLLGSREIEKLEEGEFHRNERQAGNFARTFNLPFRVDSAKVLAEYKCGILTVTLPRSEEEKPKKIEIKAA